MRSPLQTPFGAVFQTELLLNSKRVSPYALLVFFSSNAVLWSVAGAAVHYGWGTNSDFYIARNFGGFAFGILGLPLFAALIMVDPVIRDFRLGVDSLIFSKPISRGAYLFGKFCGSFFVLVCCQAGFALTLVLLQVLHTPRMVVLPFRLVPYLKHFVMLVVISYLLFAAVYFTVGTLTRNAKIVYGLAVAYYPLYIAWQVIVLSKLPLRWRVMLDPLLMSESGENPFGRSAAWINQVVVSYTPGMIANRALVIMLAIVCLIVLYFRFSIAERGAKKSHLSLVSLSTPVEQVPYNSENVLSDAQLLGVRRPVGALVGRDFRTEGISGPKRRQVGALQGVESRPATIQLPAVTAANEGVRANLRKLLAATGLELRLLRAEKSLVVIVPLAILFSFLSLPFSVGVAGPAPSASFASQTANGLLLFLLGVIVFYTGEAMHRDHEVRIEPFLWSGPATNNVLLLSKFLAMLLLTLTLIGLAGLTAIVTQLIRGLTPFALAPYLITYAVILFPSLVFLISVTIGMNILLRDKYLAYAVSIGAGAGLFYLYGQGHNGWLYNPLLYRLWTYADLTGTGNNQAIILVHRVYCLAIATGSLALAHLLFPRRAAKRLLVDGRLSGSGWALSIAVVSVTSAVILGLLIQKLR